MLIVVSHAPTILTDLRTSQARLPSFVFDPGMANGYPSERFVHDVEFADHRVGAVTDSCELVIWIGVRRRQVVVRRPELGDVTTPTTEVVGFLLGSM
ncbi:hypothetical protein ACFQMM_22470 [Saliphagus sp. GCM10025308]